MAARGSLIDDDEGIGRLLARTRRIAVLGIKTEAQAGQPSFEVPRMLQQAGLEIVPVPVYFPEVKAILGRPVYRTLAEVPGEIDLVDVFRRSKDVGPHVDDMIAKRPRAVWLQLGIRDDAAAERMVAAGIDVVQDRCLMVAYRQWLRGQPAA
jgi:predicted CoA-binding protein